MKRLLFIALIFMSGCTARAYHEYRLSQSLTTSKQAQHIKALQRIQAEKERFQRENSYCGSYGERYGSFTVSCI